LPQRWICAISIESGIGTPGTVTVMFVSILKVKASCSKVLMMKFMLVLPTPPPPPGMSIPRSRPFNTRIVSFLIDQPNESMRVPAESMVKPPSSMKLASMADVF